jgi:myo-inositol-1(or 4)-monophosphatase
MQIKHSKLKKVLLKAIKQAGKIAESGFNKKKQVNYKAETDLVTEIDIACEKKIINIIKNSFPCHDILAEESQAASLNNDYKWIIDPIDGTTNYFHNFPIYAVSIAIEYKKEIIMGAVYSPYMKELFFAEKNKGAYLNKEKIKVSKEKDLIKSLLATGFPYDVKTSKNNNINLFLSFIKSAQAVRRAGAASLDLCYTACGRFDGFWELKLKPWDMAAGYLILKEAGGYITNFNKTDFTIYNNTVIASNKHIHEQMTTIIQKTL